MADAWVRETLRIAGAVLIEGPKACGKTMTARELAASEVLLDVDDEMRAAVELDPARVIAGKTPRLIDEWQLEPKIWNHVRRAVDDRRAPGQFILAGSAVPNDDDTRHSGAGRISRVQMRPMSLHESGESDAEISLADVMKGGDVDSGRPIESLEDVADLIARGGWPALISLSAEDAGTRVFSYLDEVRRTDVRRVDGVARDPERVGRMIRSLARNIATDVAFTTLAADTGGSEGPLDQQTVSEYLRALERIFVVEQQPAWAPHLRSRYVLRRTPKRHFVDPSIAVAALETTTASLMNDLNYLGLLFESLVVRDLRIYSQGLRGTVHHYRDNSGLEVDAIVEAGSDRWAAFEIKLGGEKAIEAAAASLLKFAKRIDTEKTGEPAALGIITATGFGYTRKDGIHVIPIGALGP